MTSAELFEKLEIILIERAKTFLSSVTLDNNNNNNFTRTGSSSTKKTISNKNSKSTIQNRFILGQFYFEHVNLLFNLLITTIYVE